MEGSVNAMKQGKIHSVKRLVDPREQLFFQSHEHLLIAQGRSGEINPALCFCNYEKSLQELRNYEAAGGQGIVDAQPVGCGRMAEELKRLSEASKVEIIASTGFHKMLFYPDTHWNFTASSDCLTDLYLQELKEGMYKDPDNVFPRNQTRVKAGQIKTAMDADDIDAQYEKMFTAAADAACITGAPLMVHIENGCNPEKYLQFLLHHGVKADQMIFCHMDRACKDIGVHKAFAEAGVFLEYDTIAREKYHSDEQEIELFLEMIHAGFEDSLLFSLDTTKERMRTYSGKIGLDYILQTFLKKMTNRGITQETIDKISRKNPAVAFAWL